MPTPFLSDVDLTAKVLLSGDLTDALAIPQNDWGPTGAGRSTVWKGNGAAERNLQGMSGGSDGRVIVVINDGAFNINVHHENAGSTAANRFALPDGINLVLHPGDGITFWYDAAVSRWRPITTAVAGFAKVTVGGTILNPVAPTNAMLWRAPYDCIVTNVRGHRKGGTSATINARHNQAAIGNMLGTDLDLTTTNLWMDGGAVTNEDFVAGDDIEMMVVTAVGSPTEIAVQVDLVRYPN